MKKPPIILGCIAGVSAVLLGIGTVINIDIVNLDGSGINKICVWLMLSTSQQYWNCCNDR